jgi:thymidylate synthase (FAD)
MNDSFPKYVLTFLALIYLLSGVAEVIMVKGGTQEVFESVKTLVPHISMFLLGFYFSKRWHMNYQKVKLVSVTQGAGELLNKSAQDIIVYTARVSNPSNQMNFETSPKLLAYLISHRHWSPFEMVHMTLEITTSRGIAAQILRHRSFSFQEFSQRYSQVTEFVSYLPRRQDSKNKQNSINDLPPEDVEWFEKSMIKNQTATQGLYQEALSRGIAKECARFLLPLNTQTTLYMCGSLRSWIHYCEVRADNSTQLEHREIALDARKVIAEFFPDVALALNWNG